MNYLSELKRRNVFKVAVAYLVLSWVILQLVDVVTPILMLPDIFARIVFMALAILLPVTLVIAWAFELTPEGLKRTEDVELEESIRHSTGQKINYIIIGLLALAVIFLLYDRGREPEEVIVAEAPVEVELANTIAVMPFADMSANGDQEYFGDGMAEEILNVIVSIDELDVTSRTTAFSLKDENLSVPEIAERLNVNYILEGSIRSDGNNVRVTAQLIDVAADTHLWSETYDRELTSIFAIQDEISLAIADALKVELLGEVLGDVPTQNMEAYGLFLQARRLLDAPNYEAIVKVGEIANQMIELDPDYADAWSLLSVFHGFSDWAFGGQVNNEELRENLGLAIEAAEKAISLDSNNGYAWTRKGHIHLMRLEWKEAESALKRATVLEPNDAGIWLGLGIYYSNVGAFDDAINALNISNEINSVDAGTIEYLLGNLIIQGKFDQARIQLEKMAFIDPNRTSYYSLILSLMNGNRNKAIEFLIINQQNNDNPIENSELIIDAYFDPTLKEEYIKLKAENSNLSSLMGMLLLDGNIVVTVYRKFVIQKNNFFSNVSMPPFRPILNQQVVKDYLHEIGLVNHWREVGFPHFCRPIGDDDFECDVGDAP